MARSGRPRCLAHGQLLEFWIEADAFMRNMVRVLVGTMLEVAGGRRSPEDFERLLAGAPRGAGGGHGAAPTASTSPRFGTEHLQGVRAT